ncbi:MAG: ribbon-helix-helix protein, CopG family [Actinomycetota bacterium]
MPRTTVTIDASVLRALKRRARDEGKSLGQVISEIAAPALGAGKLSRKTSSFRWTSRLMEAKVDLEDKEALREALDDR